MANQIRISVRALVEFLLREGDIDNRIQAVSQNAMLEGARVHRRIQSGMGPQYHPEVTLRHIVPADGYELLLEGRADGILEGVQNGSRSVEEQRSADAMDDGDGVRKSMTPYEREDAAAEKPSPEAIGTTLPLIDEIKGTYRRLEQLDAPLAVHLAQAKCYAYIYALQNRLPKIRVRMTYCSFDTEELKYFYFTYTFEELADWFDELMRRYLVWMDYRYAWDLKKNASIRAIQFPYPYRPGQKELAADVYRTICHGRKLFLEAPTGSGKTLATIFPALKAIGEDKAGRIFYLTAKTVTGRVAEEAFALLRRTQGLSFKTVTLTARDKICFLEKADCNPAACPYAKGHFDRVNDAIFDLITHAEAFDRETIVSCAEKHRVCPFELALDVGWFADGVICDYNYVFDPFVYLRRFFDHGEKGAYLFLIDEAHNLLERGRRMYSASLAKEDFTAFRKEIKGVPALKKIASLAGKCGKAMRAPEQGAAKIAARFLPERGNEERMASSGMEQKAVESAARCLSERRTAERMASSGMKQRAAGFEVLSPAEIEGFMNALMKLSSAISEYLDAHVAGAEREAVLQFYFQVLRFLTILQLMDKGHLIYRAGAESGRPLIKLFCVDPAAYLAERMARGVSTILFSATFLPIQYYKKLLGGTPEDYEIYATSCFDPARCMAFVGNGVTTRYRRRGAQEYRNIAAYIHEIVRARRGNYLAFFPSHAFLEEVLSAYAARYGETEYELLAQREHMTETERAAFLARFDGTSGEGTERSKALAQSDGTSGEGAERTSPAPRRPLLGFCVLGGVFGEGIDLHGERLIGAIIVGTGLPSVGGEQELLRAYFEEAGGNGFDYAYRFPGMNKVLQAAGRVIRTEADAGVVAFLDERFCHSAYRNLFPRQWQNMIAISTDEVNHRLTEFWQRQIDS